MPSHIKFIFFLLFVKLLPGSASGQQFYRIRADFTIKEKLSTGESSLTMGTVYYDKAINKVVYSIRFPDKRILVIKDTILYSIINKKVVSRQNSLIPSQQSIFSNALSGQLQDYGLKMSFFKIDHVEREGNMVVSTWLPDKQRRKHLGKIMLSNTGKTLFGVAIFSPGNQLLSKQFFKNYLNVSGCVFPTEITQISYLQNGRNYQSTTYKNIAINSTNEKEMYNFNIPK